METPPSGWPQPFSLSCDITVTLRTGSRHPAWPTRPSHLLPQAFHSNSHHLQHSQASRTKSNVTWGRGSSSFFTVLVFSSGPLIPSLIIISGLRILQRFDPITLLYPKDFITWVHKFVYRGSGSTLDTRVCFVINSEPHLKRPSSSGTFSMKVF